jgi:hypothetical protein
MILRLTSATLLKPARYEDHSVEASVYERLIVATKSQIFQVTEVTQIQAGVAVIPVRDNGRYFVGENWGSTFVHGRC